MAHGESPTIAIDLGTANTRAGILDGNRYKIFRDENNNENIPSYVAFAHSEVLAGEAALSQLSENPTNTVYDITRLLGRYYSDPAIQMGMNQWPFDVVLGAGGKAAISVHYKGSERQLSPEEICSILLIKVKRIAESNLGCPITSAVIAVPVYFNYSQRLAVKLAGCIAGLDVKKLVGATVAAAMYHGLEKIPRSTSGSSIPYLNVKLPYMTNNPVEHKILIFDFGAGTLDVSVVAVRDGVCTLIAAGGDIHLGGEDLDNQMVNHFVKRLKTKLNTDISTDKIALSRLRGAIERAKVRLSESEMAEVDIPLLYDDFNFKTVVTKALFEQLSKEILMKCVEIMDKCLGEARMNIRMLDSVIFLGGSRRILQLRELMGQYYSGHKNFNVFEPTEQAVTHGASILASQLNSKKNHKGHNMALIDATAFSLGIQTAQGDVGAIIVPKYTPIPTRMENWIDKFHYNQQNTILEVHEVEKIYSQQNNLLSSLELCINKSSFMQIGCQHRICFEIDVDDTVTITAKDTSCGVKKSVTIGSSKDILPMAEDSKRRVYEVLTIEHNMDTKMIVESSSEENARRISAKPKHKEATLQPNTTKQSADLIPEPKEFAIGIDLGTTSSCIGVWRRNRVEIITNEYGSRTTLSCVSFTETERLIGDAAKQQVTMNSANTIMNMKRSIGRRNLDPDVQNGMNTLPFKVERGPGGGKPVVVVQYKGEKKLFTPEELTAMLLRKLKEQAEQHTNTEIKKAVITVPSHFSDSQRKATRDAGIIAGLEVMQLLNETTAAAITYYLHKSSLESFNTKNVLVFDLGGGTFDVSVLTISYEKIEVLAALGDSNLGGEDFDANLVNHFVEKFNSENKKVLKGKIIENPKSIRRLSAACEKAKRVLSTVPKTNIDLEALFEGIDFKTTVTKEEFEEKNVELVARCMEPVKRCLANAKVDKSKIDDVILVGGSTRIPMLQQELQIFFGKELCKSINPDEAVAYGATILASKLGGNDNGKFKEFKIRDVTSLSLGMEIIGGAMNLLVPSYSKIPDQKELFFTTHEDNQSEIRISFYECEYSKIALMGEFILSGIPPQPRGSLNVHVDLIIDSSGILNLSAYHMVDSEKKIIAVKEVDSRDLAKEEIESMMRDAEKFKADDDEQKKQAEAMNALENFAFRMKEIANSSDVEALKRKEIEEAANATLNWLDAQHNAKIEKIEEEKQKLESLCNKEAYYDA